jgi:hypothetical protein
MSPMIVPILAISCGLLAIFGGAVVKPWLEAGMIAEKAAQYAAQTERLEQRVRVLERIVTDGGIDLSDEIDRLRDDRAPLN